MAEEKAPQFTVTDRRKFTSEGELREGASYTTDEPSSAPAATEAPVAPAAKATPEPANPGSAHAAGSFSQEERPAMPARDDSPESEFEESLGPEPSAAETAEQHAAYQKSSSQLEDMLRQANPSAPPSIEMDFEQLVQSIYLSAIVAMGAGTEPGQKPRVDIVGARQSIDMLDVLIKKTQGNLTDREQSLLKNALFNLRMMFLEITNAIASSAQRPPSGAPPRPPKR